MNFPTDEQRILELLLKGYVIPTTIYDEDAVQNILKAKFLLENKAVKVVKEYSFYNTILTAKLDSRYDDSYELTFNKII